MAASGPRVNLGVDIGGTNLRMGLVTDDLGIIAQQLVPSSVVSGAEAAGDGVLGLLRGALEEFVTASRTTTPGLEVVSLSVGVPSTVSRDRRTVISTTNLTGWDEVHLVDYFERVWGVPVVLDRDTNFLMRHDMHVHGIGPDQIVIGCYVGTGLGNAIAIDGNLYVGAHGVAGELGHIPVVGHDEPCGCGNRGCIEPLASGAGLRDLHTAHFPGTPFPEVFTRHADTPEIERFLDLLAQAIATEVTLFDPDVVLLGGGVISMNDFPRAALEAAVRRHSRQPLPRDVIGFVYSEESQFNGVFGGTLAAVARRGAPA